MRPRLRKSKSYSPLQNQYKQDVDFTQGKMGSRRVKKSSGIGRLKDIEQLIPGTYFLRKPEKSSSALYKTE